MALLIPVFAGMTNVAPNPEVQNVEEETGLRD